MLYDKLHELLRTLKEQNFLIKLLDPIPPGFKQRGQICKLVALSAGLHWLYQKQTALDNDSLQLPPYPTKQAIREEHDPKDYSKFKSLREQAKDLHSVVGEIYNIKQLMQLGKINGYHDLHYCSFDSVDAYTKALTNAVDQDVAANVYYDVNMEDGLPVNNKSKAEHAALVLGYALSSNLKETKIILLTWDHYVAVDARALYFSSAQLETRRTPETFFKLPQGMWKNVGPSHKKYTDAVYREARAPSDDAISLRGAILFLNQPIAKLAQKRRYVNQGIGAFISPSSSTLEDFPSEAKQFKRDTGRELMGVTPENYLIARAQENKPKYIPLDILVHFLEVASLLPGRIPDERYYDFAKYFAFNDDIIMLCVKDYQTAVSGSIVDDIHRQNSDTKRSIVELTSNACDSGATEVVVNITDGSYEIIDNGRGMHAKALFTHLLIPKSSSKNMIGHSIGRFGIGFYTCLAHLKDESSSVTVTTRAHGESVVHILHFRLRQGGLELNICEYKKTFPHGTKIQVVSHDIEESTYKNYLKESFACVNKILLTVNEEQIQLSGDYRCYTHGAGAARVLVGDMSSKRHGLRMTISHVLIAQSLLGEKTNSLDVVWIFPSDTTITESRDAVQVDKWSTLAAIRSFIDIVDQLPESQRVPYLNTIGLSIITLQRGNSFEDTDNNVYFYFVKTLRRILKDKQPIPDDRDYDFLDSETAVRIQQTIIPSNWKDKLDRMAPPRWNSPKIDAYIYGSATTQSDIYFDALEKTLFVSKRLYQSVVSTKCPMLLNKLTKFLLRDYEGKWDFSAVFKQKYEDTDDLFDFQNYNPPKHHELYKKHGGLTALDSGQLDALPPDTRKILLDAPTLVARHPVPKEVKKQWGGGLSEEPCTKRIYALCYASREYYVGSDQHFPWKNAVYDLHFQPITGSFGRLLRAIMRDKLDRRSCWPVERDADKVIIKGELGTSSQLIDIATQAIVHDGLPLYSYYIPIADSGHYYINIRKESNNMFVGSSRVESRLNKDQYNTLYHCSGEKVDEIRGYLVIVPFEGGFLCFSYYCCNRTIQLRDKELNVLSTLSTTLSTDYFSLIIGEGDVQLYTLETSFVITVKACGEWLAIHYDRKTHNIATLHDVRFVGANASGVVFNDTVYCLKDGNAVALGTLLSIIEDEDKECSRTSNNRVSVTRNRGVFYRTDDGAKHLLAPNGKMYTLPAAISNQALHFYQANQDFCVLHCDNKQLLLFSKQYQKQPEIHQSVVLAQTSDGCYALIDEQCIIGADGHVVCDLASIAMKKIYFLQSDSRCPYLILGLNNDSCERKAIIVNKNGNKVLPMLEQAQFVKNTQRWIIQFYSGDERTGFLDANGIIYEKERDRFYEPMMSGDPRYVWFPPMSVRVVGLKKHPAENVITNRCYYVAEEDIRRCHQSSGAYQLINTRLLEDPDVIKNLEFLNKKGLSTLEYADNLRFIDCDHAIFEVLFDFIKNMRYTPTREQFRQYHEYQW